MADRLWIVVGDTTTSGGTVVAGAPTTDVMGKPVARLGDPVQCGRHGATSIASGDATMLIDGKPVAREHDKCACGCALLSAGQRTAFMSSGSASVPSQSSRNSSAVAAAIPSVAAAPRRPSNAHAHSHASVSFDGRREAQGGDAEKARSATQDADQALREAGAFRPYDSEVDAARAWREHVLPVADEHQVEIGSIITKTPDGKFHFGPTYSNGAYDNVSGLIEHGQYVQGQRTAYIHTHPYAGGGIGGDRAISAGGALDKHVGPDGQVSLIGGENTGWDSVGDLVSAYDLGINAYIADADGLHGFNYEDYARLQRSEMRAVPLREAYRTY